MKKRVDVYVKTPVYNFTKITSDAYDVELSVADIYRCLLVGNRVYEILNNGSKLLLTFENYEKDNNVKISPTKGHTTEPAKTPEVNTYKETLADKMVASSEIRVADEAKIEEPKEEEVKEDETKEEPKNKNDKFNKRR